MPRNPKLKDWPDCLKRLTDAQLDDEFRYWQSTYESVGHPQARKGCQKLLRDIEKEMDRREEEKSNPTT
jgi:hypothetical protein